MENAIEFARENGATHREAAAFRNFVVAAVEAEREACGEIANKKAAAVLAANTHGGRTSATASFAATMLEDVGASIRGRSNV